jgi:hypothetical protein
VRSGGLKMSVDRPIPFAVRLWTVKIGLLGNLKIEAAGGPLDILGEVGATPAFLEATGIANNIVDLV